MKMSVKQRNILPPRDFAKRMFRFFLISIGMISISLLIGILGYHYFADLGWIDSILNASMILTGMGPVDRLVTNGSKIFASFYALFSGVAFLTTIAVFLSPLLHRLLHVLHIEEDGSDND
jgi:hypothetical protein